MNEPNIIRFQCSKCGQNLEVDQEGAGQTAPCPDCGKSLTVPGMAVGSGEAFHNQWAKAFAWVALSTFIGFVFSAASGEYALPSLPTFEAVSAALFILLSIIFHSAIYQALVLAGLVTMLAGMAMSLLIPVVFGGFLAVIGAILLWQSKSATVADLKK